MAGRKPGGKKTGGRKKGTPNKSTSHTREQIQAIVDALLPDALDIIRSIEDPAKRFDAISKILPYILPKMTELKVDGSDVLNEITVTIKKTSNES